MEVKKCYIEEVFKLTPYVASWTDDYEGESFVKVTYTYKREGEGHGPIERVFELNDWKKILKEGYYFG